MLDETQGLCTPSLGCAREKKQSSWEDSEERSSAPLESVKVGMTNGAVAFENWSLRLGPKATSIMSVRFVICIVPSPSDLIWLQRRG